MIFHIWNFEIVINKMSAMDMIMRNIALDKAEENFQNQRNQYFYQHGFHR